MTETQVPDPSLLHQWMEKKATLDTVKEELTARGINEAEVETYVKEWNKILLQRKQTKGFYWLASGAMLGFISCVLTLINPIPSLYYVILYGLTSLSILVIFVGLYLVFE